MVRMEGSAEDRVMTRQRLRQLCLVVAVLAVLPYLVLKALWLGGSNVGTTSAAASTELHSARMVVGNVVTVLLVVLAVGLAAALARRGRQWLPGWVVLVLGVGAAGLLAPILLGLPLGLLLEVVAGGAGNPTDAGALEGWVYAVAYGGFGVLGLALGLLLWLHISDRWSALLALAPHRPAAWVVTAATVGMLPFGLAMLGWGVAGPGDVGPQGMESPAQRTVLAVTALLALVALGVPLSSSRLVAERPRLAWVATTVGCASTALQGPAQLLLAHDGEIPPAVLAVALVATPASCLYGLTVLAESRTSPGAGRAQLVHHGT
jgi:hypothetical protein